LPVVWTRTVEAGDEEDQRAAVRRAVVGHGKVSTRRAAGGPRLAVDGFGYRPRRDQKSAAETVAAAGLRSPGSRPRLHEGCGSGGTGWENQRGEIGVGLDIRILLAREHEPALSRRSVRFSGW